LIHKLYFIYLSLLYRNFWSRSSTFSNVVQNMYIQN